MADNLENNLKQFAQLLSQDGVAENLKDILSNLGSSSEDNASKKTSENKLENTRTEASEEDMRLMQNMVKAISGLRNAKDPSTNLISAIKPFLNDKRKKTCEDCEKMLRMVKLFEIMQNNDDGLIF